MNDAQFRRQLDNSRFDGAQPLGGSEEVASLICKAVARCRVLEEAEDIWRRIAPSQWLGQTRVQRVEHREMVIAVSDPVLRYHLRQSTARLAREVARLSSVISRIRFEFDGAAEERPGAEGN